MYISVHCCCCSITSTLDTFRIRFKISQSLTAFLFFHLFTFCSFNVLVRITDIIRQLYVSFLHHLRVVFFCQLVSELKFHRQAVHSNGCASDGRVLFSYGCSPKCPLILVYYLGCKAFGASRLTTFHPLPPAMPTRSR